MSRERIVLWEKEEYCYEASYGFTPFLVSYIHEEDTKERPCMVVVPGGGYCVVVPPEGEIVAKNFYESGYNVFVCTYTTNLFMKVPLKMQPMKDLSRAIRFIRKNACFYHIDPKKLVICGFSAGAHLCGSVCVHYEDISDENPEYQGISNRPDAAILSYPVITSGEYAHRDSFIALLGTDCSKEELDYMSLENHVTKDTPPCFIWQTATDELVPVENSFLFATACKNAHVPFSYHVFSDGMHGLSIPNQDWCDGNFGEPYTMEQTKQIVLYLKEHNIPIPESMEGLLPLLVEHTADEVLEDKEAVDHMKPNEEVIIWPEIAKRWLDKIFA